MWCAVDHEGEVLEVFAKVISTKIFRFCASKLRQYKYRKRDKAAAKKLIISYPTAFHRFAQAVGV